jgi:maleamate amidohydrolase
MSDDFEDHCWKDIVTPDVLEVYSCYRRKVFIGASPALLAIDLYDVVYRGGARPPAELAKTHPNSCGEYAFAAIESTKRLFAAARAAGLPIFYSTGDARAESRPSLVTATKRNKPPVDPADYAILRLTPERANKHRFPLQYWGKSLPFEHPKSLPREARKWHPICAT